MAEDRKARLAAMAARAGRSNKDDTQQTETTQSESIKETKTINFRNYAPKDASLDASIEEPSSKRMKQGDDNEEQVVKEEKSELEKALLQAKVDAAVATQDTNNASGSQGPIAINIAAAPKKVNWDLKRDIAKKMNRLERRTQKSIVELLRVRLELEAEAEDQNDLD